MISSSSSILTLKKMALLTIIADLSSYKPERLAKLPHMVRQKLLMNAPVGDMWRLEHSEVADGVNMEHVWTSILATRMGENITRSAYKPNLYALRLPPRESFMESVCHLIFNGEILLEGYKNPIQNFLDLLFSVRHCMGIKNWKQYLKNNPQWRMKYVSINDESAVTPMLQFRKYYLPMVTDVKLLHILMEVCQYHPKQVHILASNFIRSSLWADRSFPNVLSSFRQYLSRVEMLTFTVTMNGNDHNSTEAANLYSLALYFIVSQLLMVQSCDTLREIQVQTTNTTILASLLNGIAPLLEAHSSTEESAESNYTDHTPYKYLKELAFSSYEKLCPDSAPRPEASLCENISNILQNQEGLEKLLLQGINLASPVQHLSTLPEAITEFIDRTSEKHITFATLPISFTLFQKIVEAFLHLRSLHTQTLCFSNVAIAKASLPHTDEIKADKVNMDKEDCHHKSVRIHQTYLDPQVVFWIFDKNHHFHLHKLELDSVSTHTNMSLITAIARHSNLVIEHLVLSNINIQHCRVVESDFRLLLKKDGLRVLRVIKCNIGGSGVLNDITNAMSRLYFWPGKYIQVFDLRENRLGVETDANIRDFFVALFRLWNLQKMSLDISSNGLKPHHFYNIYSIWRMYSLGEKLRQLNCKGNSMDRRQRTLVGQLAQWVFV